MVDSHCQTTIVYSVWHYSITRSTFNDRCFSLYTFRCQLRSKCDCYNRKYFLQWCPTKLTKDDDCWLTDPSTFHITFHLDIWNVHDPFVWYLEENITYWLLFLNLSSTQIVPSNSGLKEAVAICSCFKTRCGYIANILIMWRKRI